MTADGLTLFDLKRNFIYLSDERSFMDVTVSNKFCDFSLLHWTQGGMEMGGGGGRQCGRSH
jgi:hypothetical protein